MLAELFAGMARSHEGHTTYLLLLWERVNKLLCSLVRRPGPLLLGGAVRPAYVGTGHAREWLNHGAKPYSRAWPASKAAALCYSSPSRSRNPSR